MNSVPTEPRGRARRALELAVLAVALVGAFVAGAVYSPWKGVPRLISDYIVKVQQSARDREAAAKAKQLELPLPAPPTTAKYDFSRGVPPLNPPRREDARLPEPRALQARAAVIRRDAATIADECQSAAGGDWDKWQRGTARFRDNLKARIDSPQATAGSARTPLLEGRPDFPLFEYAPRQRLEHLYHDGRLDRFRKGGAVTAAHRWLHERGIDLIVVPMPPMTAVYVEAFLDPCPPDGVIAPQMRRTVLDLLNEDVEVVDGWRLFRSLRDVAPDYLYTATGARRAPRGVRIIAKEIADRVERYAFGTRARYALPIVQPFPANAPATEEADGGGDAEWAALSPAQRDRARRAEPAVATEVKMQDGGPPPDDPTSPVIVIGGRDDPQIREQLVAELNLLVHGLGADLAPAEGFAELVRDPKRLDHCRVVVWIVNEYQLADLVALPAIGSGAQESIKSALK